MNISLSLGALILALSFCGLGDRLKELSGGTNSSGSNSSSSNSGTKSSSSSVEKPKLTSEQQAIMDGGSEVKWDDQGLAWTTPSGWKKMDVRKESFNYQSGNGAFLLVNISVMPDSFPMETSLDAYHEQALQQLKNGKYEAVKLIEIDGLKGVEFTEATPEDKDGIRRHQWIGYRTYLGQKQQVNVMTSTTQTKWDKHKDEFPAILYSMKATK